MRLSPEPAPNNQYPTYLSSPVDLPAFVGVGRVGPVSWLPSPFAFSPDLMWQLKTRSYCTIIAETIFGRADR